MEEKKTCPCCEERHKERSDKEYKDLIHRLNRMEGQIRGIKGMTDDIRAGKEETVDELIATLQKLMR